MMTIYTVCEFWWAPLTMMISFSSTYYLVIIVLLSRHCKFFCGCCEFSVDKRDKISYRGA